MQPHAMYGCPMYHLLLVITRHAACMRTTLRSMRFRFEKVIRDAQNSICAAIEEIDGTKFRQVRRLLGARAFSADAALA